MKIITMYELLGMVKDGKAPKKVKYKDKIYYYHEGYDFNYMYNSSDYMPMDEDKSLFTFPSYKPKDGVMCWDNNTAIDFLNDEVEIIEENHEEKKIPEKFKVHSFGDKDENGNFVSSPFPTDEEFMNKINDIIDYLQYIKSKE